jgi:hypothetical protein
VACGYEASRALDVAQADEVVGDDAEADPSLHAVVALVSAATEAVASFDDTDAYGATIRMRGRVASSGSVPLC